MFTTRTIRKIIIIKTESQRKSMITNQFASHTILRVSGISCPTRDAFVSSSDANILVGNNNLYIDKHG